MSTIGAIYCNRENVNHGDGGQIMSLRTLQDNKSNILGNQKHLVKQKRIINTLNQNKNNNSINCQNNNIAIALLNDRSRFKKQVKNGQPPPVAVARRNARERNRVKQVNNGFATLRQHIPSHIAAGYGDRGKKLSKVETLRMAVEYIRRLQKLLAEADNSEYESNTNTRHNESPKSMISTGSLECSGKFNKNYHSNDEDNANDSNDYKDVEIKRQSLVIRLSPNPGHNSTLSEDYFDHSGEDEENLEPKTHQRMNVDLIISRLSPTSSSSSSKNKYFTENNEENLEPSLSSPFSGDGDSEESGTTYAASSEVFSSALYYKQITETGEFMDVVTWWEQEQGKLVHQTQLHAQRLAHV